MTSETLVARAARRQDRDNTPIVTSPRSRFSTASHRQDANSPNPSARTVPGSDLGSLRQRARSRLASSGCGRTKPASARHASGLRFRAPRPRGGPALGNPFQPWVQGNALTSVFAIPHIRARARWRIRSITGITQRPLRSGGCSTVRGGACIPHIGSELYCVDGVGCQHDNRVRRVVRGSPR